MLSESDSPEQIQKCLNCIRPKCINCLELEYRSKADDLSKKLKFESDRILRLYKGGLSDIEISKRLNCHRHTVYKWRLRNELPANVKARTVLKNKEAVH